MRILVTGGLGFIGHHVTRALLARGDDVTILDARTSPVHDPSAPRTPPDGARMVEGSVTDPRSVDAALEGADAILHLAAYQDYQPDIHRFFDVNVTGTALLLERALASGRTFQSFVLASSQSVYGEGAIRCDEHGSMVGLPRDLDDLTEGRLEPRCGICRGPTTPEPTPETMTAPANAYGASKLAAEQVVLGLAPSHGIRGAALRYAIVHGAWQSPRNAYSGVLRAAVVRALEGKKPIIFEDGQSLRDYVAIEDVVSATLLALDDDRLAASFNVGGPRSWTVLELLEAVGTASGLDLTPELPGLYRVGDVRHTIGDLSALRSFGWAPTSDLTQTWKTYVEWLRENKPPEGTVDRALAAMKAARVLRKMSASR